MNPLLVLLGMFVLALFLLNYASLYLCNTDRTKKSNWCTDTVALAASGLMIGAVVWMLRRK